MLPLRHLNRPPLQTSLPGIEPALPRRQRLFFALFPDAQTVAEIERRRHRLCEEHGLHNKPIKPGFLHVTLHHLGDHQELPQELVVMASEAAARLALPPFEVTFDRAVSFRRHQDKQPFVLLERGGNIALSEFQQISGAEMSKSGLWRSVDRSFTPHVTMIYDKQAVKEQAVEPFTWTVRSFDLVHSVIGEETHHHLGSWPLHG